MPYISKKVTDPVKRKELSRAAYKLWYARHKKTADVQTRRWHENERLRWIQLLGGVCTACGEKDPLVLDFDHINNDGYLDRKKSNKRAIFLVKKNPLRFQLLCKNCNWRKEYWRRKNAIKK